MIIVRAVKLLWQELIQLFKSCTCQDTDFLVSTSEERKKMLAESLKVGVKVPRTDNNGSESLSSKLR